MKLQSNLSTTATLGTPKKWPLYRVGRSLQVFQSKLVLKVAWPGLGWPLLTGGRYSEVAVNTGLTVHQKIVLGLFGYSNILPTFKGNS